MIECNRKMFDFVMGQNLILIYQYQQRICLNRLQWNSILILLLSIYLSLSLLLTRFQSFFLFENLFFSSIGNFFSFNFVFCIIIFQSLWKSCWLRMNTATNKVIFQKCDPHTQTNAFITNSIVLTLELIIYISVQPMKINVHRTSNFLN